MRLLGINGGARLEVKNPLLGMRKIQKDMKILTIPVMMTRETRGEVIMHWLEEGRMMTSKR